MTKTIPKDPAKVQRILTAATAEFGKLGYAEAKTDQIASQAKVSKGLIFHYYHNKQGLYLAAINAQITMIYQELKPDQGPLPKDLVAMMVESARYKAEFGKQHPLGMKLMIDAFGQLGKLPPAMQAQIMAVYQEQRQISREQIKKIVLSLPLRDEIDPETVVDLVLGLSNQVFMEFQAEMRVRPELQTMADMDWLVQRSKKYMQIIEYGLLTAESKAAK